MDEPLTLRCRAALARKLIAVVLLGYMSIAVPVFLIIGGNDEGIIETLLGGCLYLVIVAAAIGNAFGLRCKMILDDEGVTFVQPMSEIRLAWNDITAIEVGGDSRTWDVEIRTTSGNHRPSALKCLRWLGQPRSLRQTVETLERYRQAARAEDE
ncbi:PH domain-containing protein [Glycomyces sp. YM15]|uniref:PH domain-containing protein n=1 Tax=Glycomyces sp. YM15 TaxID=2800446 RepID=UPI001962DA80|nr:PH domain-containing protein [Glycomyces sp. YM15]